MEAALKFGPRPTAATVLAHDHISFAVITSGHYATAADCTRFKPDHQQMEDFNVMKKLALAIGAVAFVVALGMAAPGSVQAKKRFISIGTGGPTGVYFVVGQSVCRMVHKEAAEGRKKGRKHGIRCSAPSTAGSTYNIANIQADELDFGVAQSDWQYHAVNGTSKFKGKAFKGLRAVFSVHAEPYHIIVGDLPPRFVPYPMLVCLPSVLRPGSAAAHQQRRPERAGGAE